MDVDAVMEIGRQAMWISILLTVPLLGASLIVGLVIAIFQAATSINEMTLTFVPKLMTIGLVLLFAGHWMISALVDYTTQLIENIPFLIG
jgi:flagellar biosynthetic protein FliQ